MQVNMFRKTNGNLISDGHIDIDGSVEGNVKAEVANIRPNGKIAGDIVAHTVHVYGEVHGLIRAENVHLYSSCRVEGIIMHQSLTVEDGAFIDAKFKRMHDKSSGTSDRSDAILENSDEESEDGFVESKPLRLIS
jgi:cytoskeletal protein CcmA (bactofilin family)